MEKNFSISEIQGRADFGDLLANALQPVLIEGTELENSDWREVFQSMNMQRYSMTFYSLQGVVMGAITEGQEIPFVNLGMGKCSVTAEEYGVRAGYTHQMIRDGEIDVMRYTTQELGRAYARLQCKCAWGALKAGAGTTISDATGTKSAYDLVRKAKKYGLNLKEADTDIPRPVAYDTLILHADDVDRFLPKFNFENHFGITFNATTGELSGVAGLKVLVTPYIDAGKAYAIKAKDGLLYLEREGVQLADTERFETRCQEVRLTSAFTFAILKPDNVVEIQFNETEPTNAVPTKVIS